MDIQCCSFGKVSLRRLQYSKLTGCLLLIVLMSSVGISDADKKLHETKMTLTPTVAAVGETMHATCNVTSVTSTVDQPGIVLVWARKLIDGGPDKELSSNKYLNEPFRGSGRYILTMTEPDDHRSYMSTLTISNLSVADTGDLGCKFAEAEVFKPFSVQVPVQRVWWTSSDPKTSRTVTYNANQNVQFRENEPREFVCNINGSFPKPSVHIHLGSKDITHWFIRNDTAVKDRGIPGYQSMYYSVRMVHKLNVSYEFDEKWLKCSARLPKNTDTFGTEGSMYAEKSASINVSLSEYSPKFNCSHRFHASLHEPYFKIKCVVRAVPDISTVKYHLGTNANDTMLEESEESKEFNATTLEGNDERESIMILTINRVWKNHYHNYTFEATNQIGSTKHVVELVREPIGESTSSISSNCCPQVLILLIVLLFSSCIY